MDFARLNVIEPRIVVMLAPWIVMEDRPALPASGIVKSLVHISSVHSSAMNPVRLVASPVSGAAPIKDDATCPAERLATDCPVTKDVSRLSNVATSVPRSAVRSVRKRSIVSSAEPTVIPWT